jgi:hypothetical protein
VSGRTSERINTKDAGRTDNEEERRASTLNEKVEETIPEDSPTWVSRALLLALKEGKRWQYRKKCVWSVLLLPHCQFFFLDTLEIDDPNPSQMTLQDESCSMMPIFELLTPKPAVLRSTCGLFLVRSVCLGSKRGHVVFVSLFIVLPPSSSSSYFLHLRLSMCNFRHDPVSIEFRITVARSRLSCNSDLLRREKSQKREKKR